MIFDFDIVKQKIELATKGAFTEIVSKHKDEGIYAFALYSDEGAMTVCPSTNTFQHLAKKDDTDLVYKYEPFEWKYEMVGADAAFNEISKQLYDYTSTLDNAENEHAFTQFRTQLFDVCIAVLAKLKEENFFRNVLGSDVFLTFSVSDYEFERSKVKQIITSLNDNPYKDDYLEWMKTWGS